MKWRAWFASVATIGMVGMVGVLGSPSAAEEASERCRATILFVANSVPAPRGDASLLAGARALFGPRCVTVVADEVVDETQAVGYSVVVIASSVEPAVLTNQLAYLPKPVLVSEPHLFDDFELSARSGTEVTTDEGGVVVASGRLGGFSPGLTQLFTGAGELNVIAPARVAGAVVGAKDAQGRVALFGYWSGDLMGSGYEAVAPRVGFFAGYGATLSGSGTELLHSSLRWLLSGRPRNDDFAEAKVLTGTEGGVNLPTTGATRQAAEPDHGGTGDASVWFKWVAPRSGTLYLQTFGEPVVVYRGTGLGGLERVSGPARALLKVEVVGHTTYRIATAGTGAEEMLLWAMVNPPPNDDFARAITIGGASGSIDGTNVDATWETGEPIPPTSQYPDDSVWYRWTAPSTMGVTFSVETSTDMGVTAYTGAALDSLTPAPAVVAAGTTLWIQVWTETYAFSDPAPFVLRWAATPG